MKLSKRGMWVKDLFMTLILTVCVFVPTQPVISSVSGNIKWDSLDGAIDNARRFDKLILVHVYTDWCGWCKIMDMKTYQHPEIVDYVNKKYCAVKLDASYKETIWFRGYKFPYNDEKQVHQLAYQLLDGKIKFPSTVILNEKGEVLSPVNGYLDVNAMKKVLTYFGERIYLKTTWSEYERNYKR